MVVQGPQGEICHSCKSKECVTHCPQSIGPLDCLALCPVPVLLCLNASSRSPCRGDACSSPALLQNHNDVHGRHGRRTWVPSPVPLARGKVVFFGEDMDRHHCLCVLVATQPAFAPYLLRAGHSQCPRIARGQQSPPYKKADEQTWLVVCPSSQHLDFFYILVYLPWYFNPGK